MLQRRSQARQPERVQHTLGRVVSVRCDEASKGDLLQRHITARPRPANRIKRGVAQIVLTVMGRGLVACAKLDDRVHSEASSWPEGTTITLAIGPTGPRTTVRVTEGRLHALGARTDIEPTLLVTFKNVESALPVLLGTTPILQAFAEHRSTVRGNLETAMSLVRCLHIVEGYLFPDLMTRRILPRPSVRQRTQAHAYAALLSTSTTLSAQGETA